jgi:anti-sigma factor RsiW
MSNETFDEETLMAYADGELDAERAQAVEAAMAQDESIARTVRLFRGTAAAARAAVSESTPPVPAALRAAVERAITDAAPRFPETRDTIPPAVATQSRSRPAANSPLYALAATLAFVAVGVGAFVAGSRSGGDAQFGGVAVVATGPELKAFEQALQGAPSGAAQPLAADARVAIAGTFRDRDGRVCREFQVERPETAVTGVACRAGDRWAIGFATAQAVSGGFQPAGANAALDAFLTEHGASAPMSAEEEAAALGLTSPKR